MNFWHKYLDWIESIWVRELLGLRRIYGGGIDGLWESLLNCILSESHLNAEQNVIVVPGKKYRMIFHDCRTCCIEGELYFTILYLIWSQTRRLTKEFKKNSKELNRMVSWRNWTLRWTCSLISRYYSQAMFLVKTWSNSKLFLYETD